MFRIDSDAVVDATMAGGPARYINHSCDVRIFIYLFNLINFNKVLENNNVVDFV